MAVFYFVGRISCNYCSRNAPCFDFDIARSQGGAVMEENDATALRDGAEARLKSPGVVSFQREIARGTAERGIGAATS